MIIYLDDDQHSILFIKHIKIFDEKGNLKKTIEPTSSIENVEELLDEKILPIVCDCLGIEPDYYPSDFYDRTFMIQDEKIRKRISETIEEHILENA